MRKITKKAGVLGDLVNGTGGLIITVIIVLVMVSTLMGSNLLTNGSNEYNATASMSANFTSGIGNISTKIPTILLIGAVVLLFGVVMLLVRQSQNMQYNTSGASL